MGIARAVAPRFPTTRYWGGEVRVRPATAFGQPTLAAARSARRDTQPLAHDDHAALEAVAFDQVLDGRPGIALGAHQAARDLPQRLAMPDDNHSRRSRPDRPCRGPPADEPHRHGETQ